MSQVPLAHDRDPGAGADAGCPGIEQLRTARPVAKPPAALTWTRPAAAATRRRTSAVVARRRQSPVEVLTYAGTTGHRRLDQLKLDGGSKQAALKEWP